MTASLPRATAPTDPATAIAFWILAPSRWPARIGMVCLRNAVHSRAVAGGHR